MVSGPATATIITVCAVLKAATVQQHGEQVIRSMPASAQKAAGPMDTMREGFWPPYRQERRDDGIREGYAHTNLWHPVMDREILLSQYTDMLSVGVYVRRAWGKNPGASTRKSQDAARAAAKRADHRHNGTATGRRRHPPPMVGRPVSY